MICSTLVGHSRPDPFRPAALQVLVADDHEMVRMALKHALAPLAADIVWREAVDAHGTEAELERCGGFDLALIDLHMPGSGGTGWIEQLHRKHPAVPLIVLTGDERAGLAEELIAAGVAGFIPKSDSATVVLHAVQLVLSGATYAPLRLFARTDRTESVAHARPTGSR
jgi:DNA-binding NarL/FixJ family response regulator